MNPLAWLVSLAVPAYGFPAAQGVHTPPVIEVAHIVRHASPNTVPATPAGFSPAPDYLPTGRFFDFAQTVATRR